MAKYYIIPMDDTFEPKGRIRFRPVDIKTMKLAREVKPEDYKSMTFDKPYKMYIVDGKE